MIRASGTLGDPNKLGAVAAFWTVGAIVLAAGCRSPGQRWYGGRLVLGVARGVAVGIAHGPGGGVVSVMIAAC